jgi:hypothetical protein
MSLSKSKYTRGLQCHKSLWLYQYHPELRSEPDASAQARMQAGNEIGQLAQQLFPAGVEIQFDPQNFDGMLSATRDYLAAGVKTIYEASFSEDEIFVACDILHHGNDGWELYEVKSSTKVKEYHRNDIAVQWYVLQKAGIKPVKACLVHINTGYIRQGDIDIRQLFRVVDVTEDTVYRQASVPANLTAMKSMLAGPEPDVLIGGHCNNPFECDFKPVCWQDVPEQSVLDLYRMNGDKKFALYNAGVTTLDQLPSGIKLNAMQKMQVDAYLSQRPFVNKNVIEDFLRGLTEPLYYLDFETFQEAVPRFDVQKPYEQMPFQYSLHIEKQGAVLHREFLADQNSDPRRALAEQLVKDIDSAGTIIAYNMEFEKRVINRLAALFPDLADQLRALPGRFVDLMDPFRLAGYYDYKMNGSFSIKAVLPALFPDDKELSYKSLTIANGNAASSAFANLHRNNDKRQVDQVRRDLLAYCRLDTLAMVKIVGFLRTL